MKEVRSFETSRTTYPTERCYNPEDMLTQYKNRFADNNIFQRRVISNRDSGKLPAPLAVSFAAVVSLPLSLSLVIVTLITFKRT
jgi:hypothetical protein